MRRGKCRTIVAPAAIVAVLVGGCDVARSTEAAPPAAQRAATAAGAASEGESYIARLKPLNAQVTDRAVSGLATLTVENGVLTVSVQAKGLSASTTHLQHIHALADCPKAGDDGNADHIIAFGEGLPFYGPVLVPLDDDISNGTAETYPMSDAGGRISYSASADVATLEGALGGPLELEHRTVVIHGVPGPLPASVVPANPAALPVACGEIESASR